MAVSVDSVYQKVLAFANKEQRGYITPQEFNLFADQAQMEIFEQYFYDLNQFKRVPGNSGEYSDIVSIIKDKISMFEYVGFGAYNVTISNQWGDAIDLDTDIPDLYRLGEISVWFMSTKWNEVCEQLTPKEFALRNQSALTRPTEKRPVFIKKDNQGQTRIKIFPSPKTAGHPNLPDGTTITSPTMDAGVHADYIRKPTKPSWGYVVINDKPLYNSNTSTDFELHLSEESELVYRILAFAGIAIEKPQLTQAAIGLEGAKVQQEKAK